MNIEQIYRGSAISEGIARGVVNLRSESFLEPMPYPLEDGDIEAEVTRFEKALVQTDEELDELGRKASREIGSETSDIFEAHSLILQDRIFMDKVVESVRQEKVSSAYLFYRMMQKNMEALRSMGDEYFRERAVDFEDISRRVIGHVLENHPVQCEGVSIEHIVVAQELTPSDTASMNHDLLLGFVTERGSATSHVAIIARSLNVPAVAGVAGLASRVHSGDTLLIDGYEGVVYVNPLPETIERYDRLLAEKKKQSDKLIEEFDNSAPSRTKDGHTITLSANVEFTREVGMARENKAEGIGLYRTEFLFLGAEFPDETEQTESYRKAVEITNPEPVIFRTLDIGGDKVGESTAIDQDNPFLGWRGIRLTLDLKEIFRTQLRAILIAGAGGRIGIMYPMISGLRELREANEILEECRNELVAEGVEPPAELLVGAMIEVPSAAIIAHQLAQEVDFFSIGTNDLIQYTIAVDRVNTHVQELYQPTHPAVLSLIQGVVEAAHENGIWVGVCGEMASDFDTLPLLIGLGIDELSVASAMIPRIKFALSRIDRAEAQSWLVEVMKDCALPEDIHRASLKRAKADYPELYS